MALPFLPGNSFNPRIGKSRFHKSQACGFIGNGGEVPRLEGSKPGIGGELLLGQSAANNLSVYPKGLGGDKPAWVAFDKQVLRFYAYFQEAVQESRVEQYRVRASVILFYLEDDTIQVNEPKMENSGMPQGTLIRRHRVPLPAPNDERFYTVEDMNVGKDIVFHGKIFRITDCDEFTRNFLRKLGVRVPPSETTPNDPYTMHQGKKAATMQPFRPYDKVDNLRQFLDHDREVLRFSCYWDDSDTMFGDMREMELHYFLADDTIEVVEKIPPNCGRDAVPMFLRRSKLSKALVPLKQPGVVANRTVLNVFGPTGRGGRYILDSLKTGAVENDYYHESDLTIGAVINVWGRRLLLCNCDEFTKEFYSSKYNIGNFESITLSQPSVPEVKRQLPPYNGFGSEADSLASCLNLVPKPPTRGFKKFMDLDRDGLNSNVLRFVGKLDTTRPIDMDRRFIVFYHLSDDTFTVFEPPQRNSGIIGGKFLERGPIAKPKRSESDPTIHYQAEDLYIGSRVEFNTHKFVFTDADEYALRYMEKHSGQFPHANISLILSKLRGPAASYIQHVEDAFTSADIDNKGELPFTKFRVVALSLAQGMLNDHELMTLARHYGDKVYPLLSSLIRLIQEDLKLRNFTGFAQLLSALKSCDKYEEGFISKGKLRHVCHAMGLPLSDQLVDGAIMNCGSKFGGPIDYNQFVQLLNWKDHSLPVETGTKAAAGTTCSWSSSVEGWTSTLGPIHYNALIEDLKTH